MHTSADNHTHASTFAGLTFSETTYPPSFHIPQHAHSDVAYISLALRGSFSVTVGRESYVVGRSNLAFQAIGEPRSNTFAEHTRLFNMGFSKRILGGLTDRSSTLDKSTVLRERGFVNLAARAHREFSHADASSRLITEGLALELLGTIVRDLNRRSWSNAPGWLLRVRELLHDRFTENLGLEELALSVDIHPSHLTRAFRQHFRTSPGEYQRQLRVEWSCRQLANTRSPLVDISSAAGFADQSHFSRTFKRVTGLTPAKYRATFTTR